MQIVQSPIIRLVLSVFPNCMMPLWDWLMEAVCLCSQVCQPIKETRRTTGGAWIVWQASGGLNQLWNQGEDSMNLFVAMAIISFLFFKRLVVPCWIVNQETPGIEKYKGDLFIRSVWTTEIGCKVVGTTVFLDFDGALHFCFDNRTYGPRCLWQLWKNSFDALGRWRQRLPKCPSWGTDAGSTVKKTQLIQQSGCHQTKLFKMSIRGLG